jgi:hypothetical protein
MNFVETGNWNSLQDSPITRSGDPALSEFQIPRSCWGAPGKGLSPGYVVGRRDSLTILGNMSNGCETCLKCLVL